MQIDIPDDLQLVATKAARLSLQWQNVIPLDEAESLALEGVWRAMQKHDPDKSSIGPFAHICATNKIRDAVKSELRRRRRETACQFPGTWEPADKVDDALTVPVIEKDDFWDVVDDALPPRQAELLRLVYRDGMPKGAAGRRLGMSSARVSYTLRSARERLRDSPVVASWV